MLQAHERLVATVRLTYEDAQEIRENFSRYINRSSFRNSSRIPTGQCRGALSTGTPRLSSSGIRSPNFLQPSITHTDIQQSSIHFPSDRALGNALNCSILLDRVAPRVDRNGDLVPLMYGKVVRNTRYFCPSFRGTFIRCFRSPCDALSFIYYCTIKCYTRS